MTVLPAGAQPRVRTCGIAFTLEFEVVCRRHSSAWTRISSPGLDPPARGQGQRWDGSDLGPCASAAVPEPPRPPRPHSRPCPGPGPPRTSAPPRARTRRSAPLKAPRPPRSRSQSVAPPGPSAPPPLGAQQPRRRRAWHRPIRARAALPRARPPAPLKGPRQPERCWSDVAAVAGCERGYTAAVDNRALIYLL